MKCQYPKKSSRRTVKTGATKLTTMTTCFQFSFSVSIKENWKIINTMFQNSKVKDAYVKKLQASFDDALISDVTFEVPVSLNDRESTTKEFQCIGSLFAIHSSVFYDRIYNQSPSNSNLDDVITLRDIDCATFDFLRSYVYGLNPYITDDNVASLLYCANKYQIKALKEACIDCIVKEYINASLTNFKSKTAKFLKLLDGLYEKNLIDFIEMFLLQLKNERIISSKNKCLGIINHDYFFRLPLEIFELFMFDEKLTIVDSKFNIHADQLWEVCIKWSQFKAKALVSIFTNDRCVVLTKNTKKKQRYHKTRISNDDWSTWIVLVLLSCCYVVFCCFCICGYIYSGEMTDDYKMSKITADRMKDNDTKLEDNMKYKYFNDEISNIIELKELKEILLNADETNNNNDNKDNCLKHSVILKLFKKRFDFRQMSIEYFVNNVKYFKILDKDETFMITNHHCETLIKKNQQLEKRLQEKEKEVPSRRGS